MKNPFFVVILIVLGLVLRTSKSAPISDDEGLDLGPLYSYWHPQMRDHLYTSDINEIGTATKGQVGRYGYISDGTACLLYTKQVEGSVPLYRYWKGDINNDHFYTTDPDEKGVTIPLQVGKYGYICEGNVGYCFPKADTGEGLLVDLVPLHRYWKESFKDHYYTTDTNEIGDGYVYEGIECYVVPYTQDT